MRVLTAVSRGDRDGHGHLRVVCADRCGAGGPQPLHLALVPRPWFVYSFLPSSCIVGLSCRSPCCTMLIAGWTNGVDRLTSRPNGSPFGLLPRGPAPGSILRDYAPAHSRSAHHTSCVLVAMTSDRAMMSAGSLIFFVSMGWEQRGVRVTQRLSVLYATCDTTRQTIARHG